MFTYMLFKQHSQIDNRKPQAMTASSSATEHSHFTTMPDYYYYLAHKLCWLVHAINSSTAILCEPQPSKALVGLF